MSKDYYSILGVDKSASKEDIKKAFRAKAHEYHPDKGGDEAKFKEINEAYQILGDEQKRQQYDQFGTTFDGAGGAGGFGGFSGFQGGMNFEDLGDLCGDMFGAFGGSGRGPRRARGSDILMDIDLTFKEAVFGTEKEISVSKNNTCDRCAGVGAEPGTSLKTCTSCNGQGFTVEMRRSMLGAVQTRVTCAVCNGQGEEPETVCSECHGSGVIHGRKTLRVDIPPGVENGMKIRVRNEGEAIGAAGDPGDLYLQLHVEKDPRFERDGFDLYIEKQIGFSQAALGDEVQVETVDGVVNLKIPSGTQSGDRLRLKGKGIPQGGRRGDQYVLIRVMTPRKLSKKQKQLLEELDLNEK